MKVKEFYNQNFEIKKGHLCFIICSIKIIIEHGINALVFLLKVQNKTCMNIL